MIGPFCTPHSICLHFGFLQVSFVWKCCAFESSIFNWKTVLQSFRKSFRFSDFQFLACFKSCLDKQLPKKKKYVRGNQSPFMNKTLSKAIMLRTNLRNKFLKNRSNENKTNYVKQRNHCVSFLRKTKREYYSNLDEKKSAITRHFGILLKQCYPRKLNPTKE